MAAFLCRIPTIVSADRELGESLVRHGVSAPSRTLVPGARQRVTHFDTCKVKKKGKKRTDLSRERNFAMKCRKRLSSMAYGELGLKRSTLADAEYVEASCEEHMDVLW